MRLLTVDCVTCIRCAAETKLPAAMTARNVRASSVSIGNDDINGRNSSLARWPCLPQRGSNDKELP
jgi:hypothetical protein